MKKLLKYDLTVMLHKKEFAVAFCVMMAFAVLALYQAETFLILIDNRLELDYNNVSAEWMTTLIRFLPGGQRFVYLFSFIVVLPFSMSYLAELESGMIPVLLVRVSKRKYWLSKALTCFIGNVVIIAVPLLFNYLLARIAYPTPLPNAIGIGGYGDGFFNWLLAGDLSYSDIICKYPIIPMISLMLNHRWLYLLIHIGMLALASGFAGVFLLFLSILVGRFRAVLFLPVFLLVRLSAALGEFIHNAAIQDPGVKYVSLNFMDYFYFADAMVRSLSPWYLPCLTTAVLLFCALVFHFAARSDRMILNEWALRPNIRRK